MTDETKVGVLLSVFRRHKILTGVGAMTVLGVALGVGGVAAGNEAAAVEAMVQQADETSVQISAASDTLGDVIEEAKVLAESVGNEMSDPADVVALRDAIAAAEVVAATPAARANAEMSLEEATAAHADAQAYLASVQAAGGPLRRAMDAASASHAAFRAAALVEAKSEHGDARKALVAAVDLGEALLAESKGRVADDAVRADLRVAIDAARDASTVEPAEDHQAYRAAIVGISDASGRVADASATVTSSVEAKVEADRVAAEQAEAEKAAAAQAAADAAAAEKAAVQQPAATGGGSTYYRNCAAARAAGAAPVHRGDLGYGTHLDRDGDGIGCE